jgi:hypothetical protein
MNDNEVVSDKGRNSDVSKVKAELLPSAKVAAVANADLRVEGLGHPTVGVVKKNSSGKSSVARHLLTFKVFSDISLSNLKLTAISLKKILSHNLPLSK